MSQPERELGDIANKVIFENDRVKIWEMSLEPGEESAVHQHHYDNILVQISGDRIASVPEPDTKSIYNEYMEADVAPGQVFYIEKGGIEVARNIGKQRYHEIIVELK